MDKEKVLYEERGPIALLTINRPEKLNALNRATLEELGIVVGRAEESEAVAVVVITGAGDKAFVAGADIGEIASLDALSGRSFALFGQALYRRIELLSKPVIAAVNGFALGGGCELSMACHLRVASENARFGQPEVKLGIIPGYGGTQRLPRLVGKGPALELLLTGGMIDAKRAYELGLVNAVVPEGKAVEKAMELAEKISRQSPLGIRACVEAVQTGLDMPVEEGCYLEATLFGLCCASEDMKEGTGAFMEKRKPVFKRR